VVNIRPKTRVAMHLEGSCPSGSRTDIRVRDLSFAVDEPVERGGTNAGPSPTETLLSALIACTNRISRKLAAAHGVTIQHMAVTCDAVFDRRGADLQEDLAVPFPSVILTMDVTASGDATSIARIREDLHKFCPVSRVMREAGTKIEEIWNIEQR
jgi:uncharacterized OsmC-like protein